MESKEQMLELENKKRKERRSMKKIVRLKLDGFSFEEIARMEKIPIQVCVQLFAKAVDEVDFTESTMMSEEATLDGEPPVTTNQEADHNREVVITGTTLEILHLEIEEWVRLNRGISFSTGHVHHDGVRWIRKMYIEDGGIDE